MKSKVAKRIQEETSEETRTFVRQYTDFLLKSLKHIYPSTLLIIQHTTSTHNLSLIPFGIVPKGIRLKLCKK
jgi:hypothetical protein